MLLVIINLLESQDKNKRLFSKKVTKQKKNLLPIQKKGKNFETWSIQTHQQKIFENNYVRKEKLRKY
jgi:hypothetical protein